MIEKYDSDLISCRTAINAIGNNGASIFITLPDIHVPNIISGSSTILVFYRKEKVLTIVGAFFDVQKNSVRFRQESLSGINNNHCPDKSRIYKCEEDK